MNLVKFIAGDFGVGFLFGVVAYKDANAEKTRNGTENAFRLVLWIILSGLAYQYAVEKAISAERKAKFVGGIITGILSANSEINENKANKD